MTLKNYIGISRDHSASMRPYAKMAARDYNLNIESIRESANTLGLDTIITTVKCGSGPQGSVVPETINSSVRAVDTIPESNYNANGPATPLFDSVGWIIQQFEKSPDYDNPDVSFLVMAITDGADNASITWRSRLAPKIKELQATGRWTFAFRIPQGTRSHIRSLGISDDNILEWELSESGMVQSTGATTQAFGNYYAGLARGVKSTDKFFADLSNVSKEDLERDLTPINNHEYDLFSSSVTGQIKPIVEGYTCKEYKIGNAFYQLTKTETVQRQKKIAIRDKITNKLFCGYNARRLLGIPDDHQIKLVPTKNSKYDIFVQSTSVNRKIPRDSLVLLYPYKKYG